MNKPKGVITGLGMCVVRPLCDEGQGDNGRQQEGAYVQVWQCHLKRVSSRVRRDRLRSPEYRIHPEITMSDIRIRRAGARDVAQLAPLFDGYRQFYGKQSDLPGAHLFLTRRLERGEAVVFQAETDQAVGFTLLYPIFSSVRMLPVWVLNDLFVDPDFRRLGAGRKLLLHAEEFARATGAAGLELATEKDNTGAKSVYERLGWTLDKAFDHYSRDFGTP